jgi:hypothetical protein
MADELGTLDFAGRTWPVRVAALQLTTRTATTGKPGDLFLGVGSAEIGGCGFNLENYAVRPGVTLKELDGGRIHVDEAEIQPDEILGEPYAESLIEASNCSIENEETGAIDFRLFRDLGARFRLISEARLLVELTARVVNMNGETAAAAARFEVDAT